MGATQTSIPAAHLAKHHDGGEGGSGMSLTTYPVTSSPYGQQVELTANS